jgi:hypothetical protein
MCMTLQVVDSPEYVGCFRVCAETGDVTSEYAVRTKPPGGGNDCQECDINSLIGNGTIAQLSQFICTRKCSR